MPTTPQPMITEGSFLTLHYRLSSLQGESIVSTFEENPATLQIGLGQLAPFLEQCLIGLVEGAHRTFDRSRHLARVILICCKGFHSLHCVKTQMLMKTMQSAIWSILQLLVVAGLLVCCVRWANTMPYLISTTHWRVST